MHMVGGGQKIHQQTASGGAMDEMRNRLGETATSSAVVIMIMEQNSVSVLIHTAAVAGSAAVVQLCRDGVVVHVLMIGRLD